MDTRQLDITCPCCKTQLVIDVRTAQVLRAARPAETDESGRPKVGEADWGKALARVQEREAGGKDKMDAFLEAERTKSSRLEDRFKEAKKKANERGEEPGS